METSVTLPPGLNLAQSSKCRETSALDHISTLKACLMHFKAVFPVLLQFYRFAIGCWLFGQGTAYPEYHLEYAHQAVESKAWFPQMEMRPNWPNTCKNSKCAGRFFFDPMVSRLWSELLDRALLNPNSCFLSWNSSLAKRHRSCIVSASCHPFERKIFQTTWYDLWRLEHRFEHLPLRISESLISEPLWAPELQECHCFRAISWNLENPRIRLCESRGSNGSSRMKYDSTYRT